MKHDELVELIEQYAHQKLRVGGYAGCGEVESIEGAAKEAARIKEKIIAALAEAEQRERALVEEIAYLRQYGNKDCTAMADEALAAHRTAAGEGE